MRAKRCVKDGLEDQALRQGRARGPITAAKLCKGASAAAWTYHGEIVHLAKLPLGKIPLGSCHFGKMFLGKYLRSF